MIGCCWRILNALLLQNKQDLTHVVLSIFMLDVCTFLYAQPLVSISSDQDKPEVISTCQLLIKSSLNDFDLSSCHQKDDIRNQWKNVQDLANNFLARWRSEYIYLLQTRPKWEFCSVYSVQDGWFCICDCLFCINVC